jgi:dihydroorotate dehydrogenase electron transfer subunit
MKQENSTILEHRLFHGDYRLLKLSAPAIGPLVQPGQFAHLKIPRFEHAVLRRPFSIFKADNESISILYKAIGRGTAALATVVVGEPVNLVGPLGNGFPPLSPVCAESDCRTGFPQGARVSEDARSPLRGKRALQADNPCSATIPVLVAGGYGNAALYLQAAKLPVKGVAFFGGRTAADILCVDEFEALGWDVRIATDDGSLGQKGFVTAALDAWLEERGAGSGGQGVELFACGPNAMLKAVGDRAIQNGLTAWLSMDRNMACGVGACLTCVIKRKTADGWEWARCCKDGPVFNANEILWEEES